MFIRVVKDNIERESFEIKGGTDGNLLFFGVVDPDEFDEIRFDTSPGDDVLGFDLMTVGVNPNGPPVANCQDWTVDSPGSCQPLTVTAADVATNIDASSSDPDGDPLTFLVSPEGPYSIGDTTVTLTVEDGNGGSASCDATVTVLDVDTDGDSVLDCDDLCSGTSVPEASVPSSNKGLGRNRWALVDSDDVFDTNLPPGTGPNLSYSLSDTYGCSCEDIIGICEYGKGHEKFGCSIGVMDAWTAAGGPYCEDFIPATF